MGFTDLFSEKSANYARARPTYPDALYQFVAGAAPARDRAWDCATGNGQAASGLARHFDAVCVAQALHWLDLERFYAEVRRVSKPGGVIAVWGYGWTRVSPQVDRALERHLLVKIKPYWPEQNALLIAGYKTVPFPFEPIEAPPMAIEVRWTLQQLLTYAETWTATRSYVAEHGRGILGETAHALAAVWGESEERLATMDLAMRCGRHVAA